MPRIKRKLSQQPAEQNSTLEVCVTPVQYNTAVYTRLSLEDNNIFDGTSIVSQRDMLIQFVSEQDDMRVFSEYCDNGYTGTNFLRKDFQRMLDDIKDGKVNCVVVKDLSRFARNYIEAGTYIEKIFPFMGVRFVSVNDGYDSSKNDVTDIMVTMRNIINDAYVKDISRKIKTMFETKQKNGDYIGWSAPYGYLKAEDNHNRLVVDPVTAPIIIQIFTWKADGMGLVTIARKLNEMGIPSPRMRNIQNGLYKNVPTDGRLWTDASVSWIVKSPVYIGHMAQHKFTRTAMNGQQKQLKSDDWIIVPNTHEPIVSEVLWNEAQAATRRNAETWKINTRGDGALKQRDENIVKGLLRCPYCDATLVRRIDRNSKYTYHLCNHRRINPECKLKFIREDALLPTIFEAVKSKIMAVADLQKALDNAAKSESHVNTVKILRKKIADTKNKVKRNMLFKNQLFEIYGDGAITEHEFKEMKAGYAEKITALETEVIRLEREYEKLTVSFSANNEKITALLEYRESQFLTREMLTRLVERITVYDSRNIEIKWLFADEYETLCSYASKEGGRV